MADPFREWSPGDPLNGISAELLNTLRDMAKDWNRTKPGNRPGAVTVPGETNLRLKNVSGGVLEQYSVVALGSPKVYPAATATWFFGDTVFESDEPLTGSPFAILQEPAAVDRLAPAIMAGTTFVLVKMTLSTDTYADAVSTIYTNLLSQDDVGPAEILWHNAPTAWSALTAYVIGNTVSKLGIYYTCTADHTNHAPPNASYWATSATVWALVDLIGIGSTSPVPIIAYTDATFVIPAIGGTVAISIDPAVDTLIWCVKGQTILIDDAAGHRVYGWISTITDDVTFVLTLTRVSIGSVGNTMASGASVIISGDPAALTGAITSINGDTTAAQVLAVGTSGTDFAIAESGSTHTFNLPAASATASGKVNTTTQTFAGQKIFVEFVTTLNDSGYMILFPSPYAGDDEVHLEQTYPGSTSGFQIYQDGHDSAGNINRIALQALAPTSSAGVIATHGGMVLSARGVTAIFDTEPYFAVYDGTTTHSGVWATAAGLTFSGGLMTGGSFSGTTAGSGGTTGLTLTGTSTLTLGGTLTPANGGTGLTAATSGQLLVGAGTSAMTMATSTKVTSNVLSLRGAAGKWTKVTAPTAF